MMTMMVDGARVEAGLTGRQVITTVMTWEKKVAIMKVRSVMGRADASRKGSTAGAGANSGRGSAAECR